MVGAGIGGEGVMTSDPRASSVLDASPAAPVGWVTLGVGVGIHMGGAGGRGLSIADSVETKQINDKQEGQRVLG